MSRIRKNLLANFISNASIPLLAIVFIPIYKRLLGAEAYSLIYMFLCVQAFSAILDAGLRTTISRELARLSSLPNQAGEMRNVTRSLEIIYAGLALLVGLIVVAIAPFIAHIWMKPEVLSSSEVQNGFMLMGLALAMQWPMQLYAGGLVGLQHQVQLSLLNIVMYTIRYVGVFFVLRMVPTIEAFFIFQGGVGLLHSIFSRLLLWRAMPHSNSPTKFSVASVKSIWKFTAGISGITITGLFLANTDKIILSNGNIIPMKTLGDFGMVASATYCLDRFFLPIYTAVSPRLTQLVSLNDKAELSRLYHRGSQAMTVFVAITAAVGIVFARDLLMLWTGDSDFALKWANSLALLAAAQCLNGLLYMPGGLQYAFGWTRLGFWVQVGCLVVLVPLMLAGTIKFGAIGAAGALVIVNTLKVFVGIPLMHRRLLRTEMWEWIIHDVAIPTGATFAVVLAVRWIFPAANESVRFALALPISIATAVGLLGAILSAEQMRKSALQILRRFFKKSAGTDIEQ